MRPPLKSLWFWRSDLDADPEMGRVEEEASQYLADQHEYKGAVSQRGQ